MALTRGTMSVTSATPSPFTCPSPTRQQQATNEKEREKKQQKSWIQTSCPHHCRMTDKTELYTAIEMRPALYNIHEPQL